MKAFRHTVETIMCLFGDGFGFMHKCNHRGTKRFWCENNLCENLCPLNFQPAHIEVPI